MNRRTLLLALLPAAAMAAAPVTLAPMFGSHAVLQRDVKLPVWGTAEPGANVKVRLVRDGADEGNAIETVAVAGADGRWRAVLPPHPAGGPFRLSAGYLSAAGSDAPLVAEDVLFGDVWLCSGQSNMDMSYGWGLTRGKEDMETADDPWMRLFDDRNAASITPLDDLSKPAAWTGSGFAHAKTFSACGWFFGQALRKAMPDVPIGLIEASWSGSPIKTWLSAEAYRSVGPEQSAEVDKALADLAAYDAAGGKAEYERRLALWKAECATKGDIAAEGAGFDDSSWAEAEVPVRFEDQFDKSFDGCAWYRRSFDLTAAQAAGGATLSLGTIDDVDVAWVNGVLVGSNAVWNVPSVYKVPAGVLREGRNVVAVKVVDIGKAGGFTGKPGDVALAAADGSSVALAGAWRSEGFRYDPPPANGEVNSWTPTACYNAMLHPLFPMALKGAIWYQGCSDVGGRGPLYEKKFRAMAEDWRAHFTHPDGLPVYVVQLAAYLETHAEPYDSWWADVRWSQMKLGETLPKCGTAVAIDIGHHTDIHPKDKKSVGERLARLALRRTYGKESVVEAGPIPLAAELDASRPALAPTPAGGGGREIVVPFRNGPLKTSDGGPVRGFQLVGDYGVTVPAAATIRGDSVAVAVPAGAKPRRVRYAWDDYPDCNLVNGEGLPCGPFQLALSSAD